MLKVKHEDKNLNISWEVKGQPTRSISLPFSEIENLGLKLSEVYEEHEENERKAKEEVSAPVSSGSATKAGNPPAVSGNEGAGTSDTAPASDTAPEVTDSSDADLEDDEE